MIFTLHRGRGNSDGPQEAARPHAQARRLYPGPCLPPGPPPITHLPLLPIISAAPGTRLLKSSEASRAPSESTRDSESSESPHHYTHTRTRARAPARTHAPLGLADDWPEEAAAAAANSILGAARRPSSSVAKPVFSSTGRPRAAGGASASFSPRGRGITQRPWQLTWAMKPGQ